jgi:hypothetical protein
MMVTHGPAKPDPLLDAIAQDTERSYERMLKLLERTDAAVLQSTVATLGLTVLRDLFTEPDVERPWIVDGLLPAGGLSLCVGKPKAGKSTLARTMALRVSRGEPVLGRRTEPGPVCYLSLEDRRNDIRDHFRALGGQDADPLYVFTGTRPDETLTRLAAMLATVDPVFVVVDTLQHLLGVPDLNDYARVVSALAPVLGLVRERRTHLQLVHHAGKGERIGFDAILGSTGILGTVDVAMLVRRHEDHTRTITTLQRQGIDLAESVLTLDGRGEPQLGPVRAEYEQQQLDGRVLAWLAGQPEPVTREDVELHVEGRAADVRAALYRQRDTGRVARTGKGAKGDPYLYACPAPGLDTRGNGTGIEKPSHGGPYACPESGTGIVPGTGMARGDAYEGDL